ncbi:FtsX-like permease family protein [Tetragenococcus koreensis]|uniref:FtsX-like permease family protein n=1 Tax=Tetragenococcus koreensis TaxID=290335 RepID=UPI000F4D378D|nr:FtsX-like permease family protein [Tetragenococcus koreensis]AYW45527.1 ABC transporter permease [Tetragenococcus koreensis]MCF1618205.1 FtsX-like permease family protein [Tetragenococcus koreensis]MCF1623034.1 FtsX-like permease family protein [Tetragenococcus koreensis]MCF1679031.1 FtsX-like permease family protein [Tetragenococcus koreensis]MCF1681437.1 FtsX-like permease family protein [Tetragenococcus koreensis]
MLLKLSLTGLKGRWRDYAVLFSGLTIAAGIFYMFQSMASNDDFLTNNSTVAMTGMIFQLGSVLLAIITLVYILYANSFLMSMRQKDYAMFMMLGAKQRKIGLLIFIETFTIGLLATLLGSAIGIGLTSIVSQLLTNQLDIQVTHFSPFNPKALLITLIFFTILFLLAATINASSIVRKPILSLLKANETPAKSRRKPIMLLLEAIGGILLLAVGYYMMDNVATFALLALVVALITIVLGTYFVFHSVMIFILNLLKRSDRLRLKKLNNFTLSQLSFRIQDYTKMLSMVAMIFALALGALTVGLGFRNEIPKMTDQASTYDLFLNNAQDADQKQVEGLNPTLNVSYQIKEDEDTVYFNQEQFDSEPLNAIYYDTTPQKTTYSGEQLANDEAKMDNLRVLLLPEQREKELAMLPEDQFAGLNHQTSSLQVVQVNDFMTQKDAIKKIVDENVQQNPSLTQDQLAMNQKYDIYTIFNETFSGFEFMGFFLGIAFLTMLASCLMFKILSGAASDVARYDMLNKIGTRMSLLKKSIRREIAVLFLAPGVLGAIHVLFGLKMFTGLLSEPYTGIWLPFLIFFVLYFLYYLLTIWLYTDIVLKKNK